MAEDPKRFFQQVLQRGPFYEVLQLMNANPDLGIEGRVFEGAGRYVHEYSTDIEFTTSGSFGDPNQDEVAPEVEDRGYKAIDALQTTMKEQIITWNREITKQLYADLEYNRSDEALIDWMDANEVRFDEDGDRVDITDYMPIDNLEPGVRDRVLAEYADLFDRKPEQVYATLKLRDVRFDKRGNKVDMRQFKRVEELDPAVKTRVLDKHRDFLVDGDDFWAENAQEDWTTALEELGFERIKIRYSLGYSQGDGASFTADNIDVRKLCEGMMKKQKTEALAVEMANALME